MNDQNWRILLVEDDEEDYILTRGMLEDVRGKTVKVTWVRTSQEALSSLAQSLPDVVLIDYHLGPESGLDVVREAVRRDFKVPFILLTGHGSYQVDLEAMQAGATDYLSKSEATPTLLERTVRYAIERQRLQEQNLQQKELLETIFLVDPGGVAVISGRDQRFMFVNQAFRNLMPSLTFDPLGKTVDEVYDLLGLTQQEEYIARALTAGESRDVPSFSTTYPDGTVRYFKVHLRPLFLQQEPAVLLVMWETTQVEEARRSLEIAAEEARQRAEELNTVLGQLEQEQTRLNALIASAPSGIVLVDNQGRIVLANPIAEQIYARPVPYGQPYESLASLKICYPSGAAYDPRDLPLTRSALEGEAFTNVEMLIDWPDGQKRSVLANVAPVRDHRDRLTGAVAVFVDITERKKTEEEIRKNMAQIEVQRRLMQGRDKERLRIAQDLHDGPLQGLIALTFEIKDMQNEAGGGAQTERLRQLGMTLQEQINDIRAFSQQLRPPVLAPFGLEKAIRSHAAGFEASHPELNLTLDLNPDGRSLSDEVRLALYRIYQELLNNIVRHAEASEVEVRLKLVKDQVILEVEDNGCGFEVPSSWVEMARQGHLGLVGVQERAGAVNGIVEIHSRPESGTIVRVVVPI